MNGHLLFFFFFQSDTFIYVHFFKNRQAPKFNEQLENSINCSHRWQEGGHGTCTFPRASQNMQSVWPRATRTTWQHRKTKKVGIGAMKKPKKYIILISGRKTIKKTKKKGFGSEKTVKKIRRNPTFFFGFPTFFLVFRRFPTKSDAGFLQFRSPRFPNCLQETKKAIKVLRVLRLGLPMFLVTRLYICRLWDLRTYSTSAILISHCRQCDISIELVRL